MRARWPAATPSAWSDFADLGRGALAIMVVTLILLVFVPAFAARAWPWWRCSVGSACGLPGSVSGRLGSIRWSKPGRASVG
jgi:hypothetical protein